MVQVAIAKPNRRIIEHVENTKANHKWFISLALSLTSALTLWQKYQAEQAIF